LLLLLLLLLRLFLTGFLLLFIFQGFRTIPSGRVIDTVVVVRLTRRGIHVFRPARRERSKSAIVQFTNSQNWLLRLRQKIATTSALPASSLLLILLPASCLRLLLLLLSVSNRRVRRTTTTVVVVRGRVIAAAAHVGMYYATTPRRAAPNQHRRQDGTFEPHRTFCSWNLGTSSQLVVSDFEQEALLVFELWFHLAIIQRG